MKKWIGLSSSLFLVMALSGCGSDVRETLVSRAIEQLNKAADLLANIKENVEKWEKETNDTKKAELLKNALVDIKSLTEVCTGTRTTEGSLQDVRQRSEKLEPLSKEKRDEYKQQFQERLRKAVHHLSTEQTALNEVLIRAEKTNRTALAELRQKLQQAQGEFESLTKQR